MQYCLEYRQSGKVTFRSLMAGLVDGDKLNINPYS